MDPDKKQALAGMVAMGVLLIFLVLFVPLLVATFNAPPNTPPALDPAIAAFMTTVAAGVGGFLATLFGVPGQGLLGGKPVWWKPYLAGSYIVAYFGVTLVAIGLWVAKTPVTPGVLSAQALTGFGLGAAVAISLAKEI